MVAALGVGSDGYPAAMFHLFTHAFFKALLFLCAGSVIHAAHSNNMSEMGGLRRAMPITFVTFAIGAAALGGIPPLAGFGSKGEIISTAFHQGHYALGAVTLVTAVITACYTMRVALPPFLGDDRGPGHRRESPSSF